MFGTHLMQGQRALQGGGVKHVYIGTANPTYCNQVLKTRYDFGPVLLGGQDGEANAKAETLPFLPLDLGLQT